MRESEPRQTGSIGESEVEANFKRIGWAPVRNSDHDLGTDYLVAARDSRRFDRGLIVGVQVKAGTGCFSDQVVGDDGTVSGWWYYERSTDHFDDWVTHGLPHLVVLHDLDTRISYWVHVTADAVDSTGKGCKILVPADQTIDEDHADDLYAVASKQKAAPTIEGSAFLGMPGGIPPARRLRFSLIAPRLVAPHPGTGLGRRVDAVEAIALLAQGRFADLRRFADKHPSVPDPSESNSGRAWTWQLVGAIWNWAMTDSTDRLTAVLAVAPSKEAKAASGVLLACALQRLEQHSRAMTVLDGLVDDDDLLPADHGWALVQRARVRAETGDISGARRDAAARRAAELRRRRGRRHGVRACRCRGVAAVRNRRSRST